MAAEEAIRGKKACLVIVAGDASANTKKKFHNSASFYEVPILELGTKADLGRAVGEEIRAVLVVTEADLRQNCSSLHRQQKTQSKGFGIDVRQRRGAGRSQKCDL